MTKDLAEIKLFSSCLSESHVSDENVVPAHSITYIYEGEFEMVNGAGLIRLGKGGMFYTAKNTLFRFTKVASKSKPFKSITVVFGEKFLQEYFQKQTPNPIDAVPEKAFPLKEHRLWGNFFSSLQPYVEIQDAILQELCTAKQLEALAILRSSYPAIDAHLSHFGMPGKIDLEAFMQQNYIFNLTLNRFAYLTGRSVSTFKRDFFRIFQTTPQRWLTHKRLQLAHYLIEDQKIKPSKAFIDAGFENLSHFSRAFKEAFGYSPKHAMNI